MVTRHRSAHSTGCFLHKTAERWWQGARVDMQSGHGMPANQPCLRARSRNSRRMILPVAVIGVPDAVTTESIKAYVVLRPGIVGDAALIEAIRQSVRARLARHETPRAIEFVEALPMTATGKIMRRELRDRARKQR